MAEEKKDDVVTFEQLGVADKTSVSDTCDSGLSCGIPNPDRHKTAVLSRESGGRSGDIDCGGRNYFLYL